MRLAAAALSWVTHAAMGILLASPCRGRSRQQSSGGFFPLPNPVCTLQTFVIMKIAASLRRLSLDCVGHHHRTDVCRFLLELKAIADARDDECVANRAACYGV
jgi:hypothetical protein